MDTKKPDPNHRTAVFAGGCFWCMQPPFDNLPGVVKTTVGYTGGLPTTADYESVSSGATDHLEAIEVRYDPAKVSYEQVLDVFWRSIDPTDPSGQFADRGKQYQTAIYVFDDAQRKTAEKSKAALQTSGRFAKPVVVPVLEARPFYPAEEYHQKYYRKNPLRYHSYKYGSGRAPFIEGTWFKETEKAGASR